MKLILAFSFASTLAISAAQAQVTTFTNSADFHSANPDSMLIESFEGTNPAIRDGSLTSYSSAGGEITFTPIASYPFDPNLVLASPGYTNFGSGLNPTSSVVLTSTGNEDFVASFASPTYALGFDVLLNDFPLTISFFDGATLLATLDFDTPPQSGNNLAFAGITSTEGVTSFHWQATEGQNVNTAIDNVFFAPGSVPEPSSWAMMLLGFAAVGLALRQRGAKLLPRSYPESVATSPQPTPTHSRQRPSTSLGTNGRVCGVLPPPPVA